ncbi:MAG: hypothetical protein II988_00835 [Clostridia bacterium]|nr:hypothetical protein [Clostridia bacterium]
MKKLLLKILLCVMSLCVLIGVSGCKEGDWQGTSMKNWGEVVSSNAGFMVETENYFYYINGYASYGDDNTFGTPVKGALMAVEKASLLTDNVKTEVVVPKLFVASDYQAGVYIYGDYVYYGTSSTDKNNQGEIAVSELTFTRTKLDGSATEKFFTVDSLSTQYRFVENDGKVYLVWYDAENTALKVYNTSTKSEQVIAKTDSTTKGKFESLAEYKFVEGEGYNGVSVIYTVTVYEEDYYEKAAEKEGYSRATASYNKVYAYSAGDGVNEGNEFRGQCVLNGIADNDNDGKADDCSYQVTLVKDGFVFYTQNELDGSVKTFGVDLKSADKQDLFADAVKIINDEAIAEDTLFVSFEEVYQLFAFDESDETQKHIVRTTLLDDADEKWLKIAFVGGASDVMAVRKDAGKDYVYYINENNAIARVEVCEEGVDEFAKEERVSDGGVVYTWYAPEIHNVGEKTFVFYADNTSRGGAYVKMVEISQQTTGEEDTNDDGEIDVRFLENSKLIGKITEEDKAVFAIAILNEITSPLEYEEVDGVAVCKAVVEAREAYDALSETAKEFYTENDLEVLERMETAANAIKYLVKLKGIENYYFVDETAQQAFKDAYLAAKPVMDEINADEDVLNLIENNLKWSYYNKAIELFAK